MIITAAIALNIVKGLVLRQSPVVVIPTNLATPTSDQQQQQQQSQQPSSAILSTPPAPAPPSPPPPPPQEYDPNTPYITLSDCHACPTPCPDQDHLHYPPYLKIDQELPLLNSTKPYSRHVLISTGKDDWEASIDDDKDSLAPYMQQAINEGQQRLKEANGDQDLPRIVLTNSSRVCEDWEGPGWQVIVLPDQIVVNNVTQDQCHDFFEAFLKPPVGSVALSRPQQQQHLHQNGSGNGNGNGNSSNVVVDKDYGINRVSSLNGVKGANGAYAMNGNDYQNGGDKSSSTTKTEQRKEGSRIITTTTTITKTSSSTENGHGHQNINGNGNGYTNGNSYSNGNAHHYRHQNGNGHHHFHHHAEETEEDRREVTAGKTTFIAHKWKPKAALMICSHRKRDKRCGVTAQILKKEFTRILRSRDIYGDCEDDVEIWLISHIGGHKFAGNVIVHRREGGGMAVWYGRVEPCHAEAIVERTIINGEVIKELHRGSMIGSFNSSCKKMAW